MQSNKPPKKKRRLGLGEIKLLIAALGVAGTVGFWNLFARQLDLQAALALNDPQPAPTQPAEYSLDLPPLPTLVPEAAGASLPAAPSAAPAAPRSPAIVQAPSKIILGGPAPRRQAPAPVTRTRSSR